MTARWWCHAAAAPLVLVACAVQPTELTSATVWQQSVLNQISEAWSEHDVERVAQLLAQPRSGANPEQLSRFASFDELLAAATLEQSGFARRGFAVEPSTVLDRGREPPDLEMDEALPLRVVLEPAADRVVRVLARAAGRARSVLLVTMQIEDVLEDGSRVRSQQPFRHTIETDLELTAERAFTLEVPAIDPPAAHVKLRKLRYTGVLLVAGLEVDGRSVPVAKLALHPFRIERFPRGFRKVRAKPVAVLRAALIEPRDHLAHILVASHFIARDGTPNDREAAIEGLIELLRTGPDAAEATARACLLDVAGEAAPGQRDRDGWLRWQVFRERRAGAPGARK